MARELLKVFYGWKLGSQTNTSLHTPSHGSRADTAAQSWCRSQAQPDLRRGTTCEERTPLNLTLQHSTRSKPTAAIHCAGYSDSRAVMVASLCLNMSVLTLQGGESRSKPTAALRCWRISSCADGGTRDASHGLLRHLSDQANRCDPLLAILASIGGGIFCESIDLHTPPLHLPRQADRCILLTRGRGSL